MARKVEISRSYNQLLYTRFLPVNIRKFAQMKLWEDLQALREELALELGRELRAQDGHCMDHPISMLAISAACCTQLPVKRWFIIVASNTLRCPHRASTLSTLSCHSGPNQHHTQVIDIGAPAR